MSKTKVRKEFFAAIFVRKDKDKHLKEVERILTKIGWNVTVVKTDNATKFEEHMKRVDGTHLVICAKPISFDGALASFSAQIQGMPLTWLMHVEYDQNHGGAMHCVMPKKEITPFTDINRFKVSVHLKAMLNEAIERIERMKVEQ